MNEPESSRPGVLETLRRLFSTSLGILQNRLELLVVELQEERLRVFNALLLLAVIVALGLFTFATGAAVLVIVLWDHLGVLGLLVVSGISLAATLFAYWRPRVHLSRWPLLPETVAELKKDREWLANKS